jgi:hypothetical protein
MNGASEPGSTIRYHCICSLSSASLDTARGDVPGAEVAAGRLLSLPLYPHITSEREGAVVDALRIALSHAVDDRSQMRRLHRYPRCPGRSRAITGFRSGTLDSLHHHRHGDLMSPIDDKFRIAVIRGVGSSVVRVADERLPSRLRYAAAQSWRGNFGETGEDTTARILGRRRLA